MSKKIISLFLAMAILFSLARCGLRYSRTVDTDDSATYSRQTNAEKRKERVVAEATEYLKDNYPDDEFTYVSGRSPDWAYPYYELAFTTKKYDDQEFTVYGVYPNGEATDVEIPYFPRVNTEQEFEYYDTYYQYSMKQEAEKYILDLSTRYIDQIVGLNITFGRNIICAQDVDYSKSFSDNLENGNLSLFFRIKTEMNMADEKKAPKELAQCLIDKKIFTYFLIEYKKKDNDTAYSGLIKYKTYNGIIMEEEIR